MQRIQLKPFSRSSMKIHILAATALTFAAATVFAATKDFDRTLNVSASPTVSISTGSGHIHLNPGSDNKIHIIGHVHSSNSWGHSDSEARVQQIASNPPIVQNGNNITIGEEHSSDLFRNIGIDYEIALPRASSIRANTGSGDVEIQDVGATLKAESGSGSVRARGVHGAADLQTGSGDIELQQTAGGDVRAQTGSGSIRLSGLSGGLKAGTGSGDIQVTGQPNSDWKLDTGSGSIHLTLASSSRYTLNVGTGSGTIHTTQPITMQGEINKHHITGTINGGGPIIRANTGSGDIDIL
jgi:Putative adhesin